MGKTKLAQMAILEELGKSLKGKRELKKVVRAKDPSLRKHIKKALKKLIKKGVVEEDDKNFRMVPLQKRDTSSGQSHVVHQQRDEDDTPIAVRLRNEQDQHVQNKVVSFADEQVDLDDEIRRLEAELNQSSCGSSDDESSASVEGDAGVLSLSAFANDHIEHLPDTYLPEPGRYKAQGPAVKKKSRKEAPAPNRSEGREKMDGLKEAVKEVLSGYKPRSSERLPFYCRFCSQQYRDEKEFFEHKSSDFHKLAVDIERKATYCRLCRKQLTSPDQMKEHLASKPHRERLQKVRSRQGTSSSGENNNRNKEKSRQWT
jgi:hypothetical protein